MVFPLVCATIGYMAKKASPKIESGGEPIDTTARELSVELAEEPVESKALLKARAEQLKKTLEEEEDNPERFAEIKLSLDKLYEKLGIPEVTAADDEEIPEALPYESALGSRLDSAVRPVAGTYQKGLEFAKDAALAASAVDEKATNFLKKTGRIAYGPAALTGLGLGGILSGAWKFTKQMGGVVKDEIYDPIFGKGGFLGSDGKFWGSLTKTYKNLTKPEKK